MATKDTEPVHNSLTNCVKSRDRNFISRSIVAGTASEIGLPTRSFKYLPLGTLFFCLERRVYEGPNASAGDIIFFKKLDGDGNCDCYRMRVEDIVAGRDIDPEPLAGQTALVKDLEALVTTFDDYMTRQPK